METSSPTSGELEGAYVYQYKDHLGNVRLSYTDNNNDGIITASSDPSTTEIIEESNYYPFGLKHKGYNGNISSIGNSVAQKFGYNGKELEESLGLDLYEMDMRQYDPAIARWTSIDPVIHHSMSTYNAFDNNPVFWADPSGADAVQNEDGWTFTGEDARNVFNAIKDIYGSGPGDGNKKKKKKRKSQKKAVKDMSAGEFYAMAYNGHARTAYSNGNDPYNPTESDIAQSDSERDKTAFDFAMFLTGEWVVGKALQGLGYYAWGATKILSRSKRLNIFRRSLKRARMPKSADEAIELINKELDRVEDLYSGVKKNPNAATINRNDGRMYGILDDTYVTRHAGGNVTAMTKGHRIEVQANGSFSIFNRKTGELFLKK